MVKNLLKFRKLEKYYEPDESIESLESRKKSREKEIKSSWFHNFRYYVPASFECQSK
jgi:hypothetical protein